MENPFETIVNEQVCEEIYKRFAKSVDIDSHARAIFTDGFCEGVRWCADVIMAQMIKESNNRKH